MLGLDQTAIVKFAEKYSESIPARICLTQVRLTRLEEHCHSLVTATRSRPEISFPSDFSSPSPSQRWCDGRLQDPEWTWMRRAGGYERRRLPHTARCTAPSIVDEVLDGPDKMRWEGLRPRKRHNVPAILSGHQALLGSPTLHRRTSLLVWGAVRPAAFINGKLKTASRDSFLPIRTQSSRLEPLERPAWGRVSTAPHS